MLREFERFQAILCCFAARTGQARRAVVDCEANRLIFDLLSRLRHYTTIASRSIAEKVLPMLVTAMSVLSAGPMSITST